MILASQNIRRFAQLYRLIEPFNERTVLNGKTYGLSACGYDVRVDLGDAFPLGWCTIRPGGFELFGTLERFNMPTTLAGMVKDKSSWARRGVCVQNTVIEPGWCGFLTLEVTNHSKEDVLIKQGDPIAQIIFQWLDAETQQPYDGKYQNQMPGPQAAIEETS